jgi:hypothetical protein
VRQSLGLPIGTLTATPLNGGTTTTLVWSAYTNPFGASPGPNQIGIFVSNGGTITLYTIQSGSSGVATVEAAWLKPGLIFMLVDLSTSGPGVPLSPTFQHVLAEAQL